jgi:hypothetical protein
MSNPKAGECADIVSNPSAEESELTGVNGSSAGSGEVDDGVPTILGLRAEPGGVLLVAAEP